MGNSFRHSVGFGKRIEYFIVSRMLMKGLDCYMPLVDDHGVDCIVKKKDGTFIELQIKARSNEVAKGDAALFAAINHELTPNYYFIFYSECLESMWIMSSEEFLKECTTNNTGKMQVLIAFGLMDIELIKNQALKKEYCNEKYNKYRKSDFKILE